MRKAAIIDLDQTFVSVNTFQKYIMYIGQTAALKSRIDICLELCVYVIIRKLRLISHEKMKKHILRISADFFSDKKWKFAEKLTKYASPTIIRLINDLKKDGYFLCMSTAAPTSYVEPLASIYGFDGYVATSDQLDDNWHENSKENKCKHTLSYLKSHDLIIDILATDHYDDLPLLRVKKSVNYLVNPSDITIQKVQNEGICFVKVE